ncbi:MAG: SusC/RagA family TonB-linked outer membrane protein [Candidatus Pseudobacter hemicellulosilyticus]|uniref:SusC/RagA family TonB-linked outer membrane protein n=1 Tax=Candidatus Pseudobacter hemicellulosilyticus TaxID=3121375 RepID=A0AAJ5WQB5_9BACT|nr:MAG: SusC/RagA family TonB-linked outer membrane protein [Pseudobacter sp.]
MRKPGFITAFIVFFACLLFVSAGHAQVSLSYRQAPIAKVLAEIQRQTDYNFFHRQGVLQKAGKVTIQVTDMPLIQVLNLIFRDQPLEYVIDEKNITIRPRAGNAAILPPAPLTRSLEGRVINELDQPVISATVHAIAGQQHAVTDANGIFVLENFKPGDSVLISSISYQAQQLAASPGNFLLVRLQPKVNELTDVSVVSSGYQTKSRRLSTGSYDVIGREKLQRRISTNFMDRLEGISSSLLRNRNIVAGINQTEISIRGRSTIYSNAEPLIVLDNFPFYGPLSSINPNDVDSVTILKDAAASAIWGAYAGNGVIVITSKKGNYKMPLKLTMDANVTVGDKPDLYYQPYINSADQVELEKLMFANNIFRGRENNFNKPVLTDVVEILIKKREGKLTADEADAQLEALKKNDGRADLEKYVYRHSINQQYSLNLRGGTAKQYYSVTGGYDHNLASLVGQNGFRRWTLNGSHTLSMWKRKLELTTGVQYTGSENRQNDNFKFLAYPYQRLVDEQGNAAIVPNTYRKSFIDTAGRGRLLDWTYRPLAESGLPNKTTRAHDYRINLMLTYRILPDLSAELKYQYSRTNTIARQLNGMETFSTRDLINKYTQIGPNGEVVRPIPLGGILDEQKYYLTGKNYRGQLNYHRQWNKHGLQVLGGVEVRNVEGKNYRERTYGYDETTRKGQPVDYTTSYTMYYNTGMQVRIPEMFRVPYEGTVANYISWYMNADYSWKNLVFSASGRKEESNIFGVETNQKGVPLWAVGAAWIISDEAFYKAKWLPYLKLRVSDGYSGNVDRNTYAFITASRDGQNSFGASTASISNPPNPDLRWEKVNMINFALDFKSRNNRLSGSIEYYIRNAKDLIGYSPIDPTTGTSVFRGNNGEMKGRGIDVLLNTINLNRKFQWKTSFLFSYNYDEVATYEEQQASISYYYNSALLNPLPDKPLYSVYSVKWGGLDPQNGDPVGFLNGSRSKDYSAIMNSNKLDDLIYNGPVNPVYFASVLNSFSWKNFELSFNIIWKAGHYFRRPSIHYSNYFTINANAHPDIVQRWKEKGDEAHTNVPSIRFPADANRDTYYNYSEILVEKGDLLRLQDMGLSYRFMDRRVGKLPVEGIRLYTYVNNIGLLWRANDKGIDPDFVQGYPDPLTVSVGMKIDL